LIHELSARTNHVHIVVTADASTSKLLHDLKSWATRRLVECELVRKGTRVWAEHGSTVWLFTQEQFHHAISYVRHQQGAPLPMVRPALWNDAW
jgi:REP element-mobilizing transposase RayT